MSIHAEIVLPALPESASRARRFLRDRTTLDSMRYSEADLLVTEMIGNAINHSPDSDDLTLVVDGERPRSVMVSLRHPHPTPLADPEPGVGFMLLDRLSRTWGHEHDGENLTVWFELRTPGVIQVAPELTDEDLLDSLSADPASYTDELVRRHSDLARSISRRYRGKGIDEEDLLQVANMALLKAIQRYDSSLGSLRPYAAATISGELKRLLRDKGWSVRVPRSLQERSLEVARVREKLAQELNRPPNVSEVAEKLGISDDEVVEALDARRAYASSSMDKPGEETGVTLAERIEDEDVRLLMADDRIVVEEAMAKLPERQQRILQLRFNDDLTQSEIADEIGISQMHVSRLLTRSLESLKNLIGEGQVRQ